MDELDELLAALEEREKDIPGHPMDVISVAYRKYKAATPPLVLEAVEFPGSGDEMIVTSGEYIAYRCACYRLPDGGDK